MNDDIAHYKIVLEKRRAELEEELSSLGFHDKDNSSEWFLKSPELDILSADENEIADKSEEAQVDSIIMIKLLTQYKEVLHALENIEQGKYGVCEVCGAKIEDERLKANPSACTCEQHLEQEEHL